MRGIDTIFPSVYRHIPSRAAAVTSSGAKNVAFRGGGCCDCHLVSGHEVLGVWKTKGTVANVIDAHPVTAPCLQDAVESMTALIWSSK